MVIESGECSQSKTFLICSLGSEDLMTGMAKAYDWRILILIKPFCEHPVLSMQHCFPKRHLSSQDRNVQFNNRKGWSVDFLLHWLPSMWTYYRTWRANKVKCVFDIKKTKQRWDLSGSVDKCGMVHTQRCVSDEEECIWNYFKGKTYCVFRIRNRPREQIIVYHLWWQHIWVCFYTVCKLLDITHWCGFVFVISMTPADESSSY